MTRISSGMTWFHKRVFPVIWFGFLAVFLVATSLTAGPLHERLVFLLVTVLLAGMGVVVMKLFILDLMDEVLDGGEYLLVRNRGDEDRIPIADIMNVSATMHVNPPRLTLRLARPSRFGSDITFSPVTGFRLNPFAKNAIAEDLIVRVDRARRTRP